MGGNGTLLYAVTPNILEWTTGTLKVNWTSMEAIAYLDTGAELKGKIIDCEEMDWGLSISNWYRIPDLEEVHVVFMNHLDVGYNGIPKIGFINNVLNKYFDEYYPRAISLGEDMDKQHPNLGFVYTTHSWLVYMYLNCPPGLTLNNITIHCPSPEQIQTFEEAIKKGYIHWHAGPMNMQMELMNKQMLDVAKWMSMELDQKYGKDAQHGKIRVWSQRDVPGMTKGVIKYFLESGIGAVSVGVNSGTSPPAVPKIFLWKEDESDEDGVIAMWIKGGYPGPPGKSLDKPDGVSIRNTIFSKVDKQALVFAFRTDNRGPPESIEEIMNAYSILQEEYIGAKIFASTMENFVNKVTKSSLPVITNEIGDTWIMGVASDPRKMALYRAAIRALDCHEPNCKWEWNSVRDFAPYLLKLPEHTWGLPSVGDNSNWMNDQFDLQLNSKSKGFIDCIHSWQEQRLFFNLTLAIAEKSAKWYADNLIRELEGLRTNIPAIVSSDFVSLDRRSNFIVDVSGGSVQLSFTKTGSINNLSYVNPLTEESYIFASEGQDIGLLSYNTYNGTDFDFMSRRYNYYGNAGFSKPGSDKNAHPNSTTTMFVLNKLYWNKTAKGSSKKWVFLLELVGDSYMNSYYGSPEKVWIQLGIDSSSKDPNLLFEFNYDMVIVNKTSTRLPESTMFSFVPTKVPSGSSYKGYYHKVSEDVTIPVESVILNGSQYQHVVESAELVSSDDSGKGNVVIKLSSPDVPLVCPIVDDDSFRSPTPFAAPLEPIEPNKLKGFAFNIHNNVWNTNYPLWYPFVEEDKHFRSRYKMAVYRRSGLFKI